MEYFYAVLAPLLYAIGNILDSYLVKKYGDDDDNGVGGLVLVSALFSFIVLFLILIFKFNGVTSMSLYDGALLILNGILTVCGVIFYLYALDQEEVTSVAVWWQLVPVLVYFIGLTLLREKLSPISMIGGFFILVGVVVVNINTAENVSYKNIFNLKVLGLMLPAVVCLALSDVLFKYATISESGFWVSSFYENIGILIVGLVFLIFIKKARDSFFSLVKRSGKSLLLLNFTNEVLYVLANLSIRYASLFIPVVVVSLLNGLNLVFVFLLGMMLTLFSSLKFTEDMTSKTLSKKVLGILVVVIGLLLL